MPISLEQVITNDTFDEEQYLTAFPDVAEAVRAKKFQSGLQHFEVFGQHECRKLRTSALIEAARAKKLERLRPCLRTDMAVTEKEYKPNYLSDELRSLSGIVETNAVSSNGYDCHAVALIERHQEGLVLDCGAGKRDIYYENSVNFEIVDYDTTDILGVGEELPFADNTFDGVISIAVLEHVKDPFRCAKEIARVLKPGGELYCSVPFLQPLHGYPHHYYNMSHQGLWSLFDPLLRVTHQDVLPSTGPIWALTWMLQRWAEELPEKSKQQFMAKTVGELMSSAGDYLNCPWVTDLPKAVQFELASATTLHATKRS